MALFAVNNLGKYYGAKLVFKNITFEIDRGQRIGLIGPNGVGKTTLLKIIMGQEDYQEGEIFQRQNIRLDYLDQIPNYPEHYRTIDVLMAAFSEILDMRQQLLEYENRMADCSGDDLTKVVNEYGQLEHLYEQRGGYAVQEKLSRITIGLQIDSDMQTRSFGLLSGGEKSRVVLGKILLEEPDILLLDEPSNHLDINFMNWLEEYLREYQGAVVIISHDRWFLNRAVNRIIELANDGVELYAGNYSYYQQERQRRLEERFNNWQAEQRRVDKLEQQIERYLIWARSRDSEKMYRRAKELRKRLAKIDVPDKPQMERKKIHLHNDRTDRTGREVLRLTDVGHSFVDKTLFREFSFTVYYQDRIGIVGPNGAGKSTLIKIMLKQLEAQHGVVVHGARLNIGYLPQEVEFENPSDTLIEAFQREYDITITNARHELARVLFTGDDVFMTVDTLSGGERSRLKLCLLMYGGANLLILDEPTNHLDIESREILEETLQEFSGTIIFVSHDRYFIDNIANRILEMKDGKIEVYNGDYQYWLAKRDQRETVIIENEAPTNSREDFEARKAQQSELRRLQKQLKTFEEEISMTEQQLISLSQSMVDNAEDAEMLQTLYQQQQQLEERLLELIDCHEKLMKQLEQQN